jgi:hypothetical protein
MASENVKDMTVPSTLVIGGKEVDGRTIPAKRYKAVCTDLANDIGGDPTSAQWLLICRAAGLTVQCELKEADLATGNSVDIAEYTALAGTLIRVLKTLGLDRQAKDASPKIISIDAHARAVKAATK